MPTTDLSISQKAPLKDLTSGCPECDGSVSFDSEPMIAEIVMCAECRAELEVIAVAPTTLALAPEIQEDWGE